ncbi:MAG: hypothetical protein ACPGJS_07300 [Flammeovirgaceae bacterium]
MSTIKAHVYWTVLGQQRPDDTNPTPQLPTVPTHLSILVPHQGEWQFNPTPKLRSGAAWNSKLPTGEFLRDIVFEYTATGSSGAQQYFSFTGDIPAINRSEDHVNGLYESIKITFEELTPFESLKLSGGGVIVNTEDGDDKPSV